MDYKGTDGIDQLTGTVGNDTFEGGKGDDVLKGSYGNDTYIFNRGDGQDTITDIDKTVGSVDKIKFGEGILPEDLRFSRVGNNLKIWLVGTSDSITISFYYSSSMYKIEQIEFANKTIWDQKTIESQPMYILGEGTINGTNVDEIIDGSKGVDIIDAKGGNDIIDGKGGGDTIKGGTGNDTYIFNLGYGQLIIEDEDATEGNIDIIKFGQGINPENIVFNKVGLNLEITISGTADKITITNYYKDESFRIEQINFFNGVIWTKADINARPVYVTGSGELHGTVGVDIMTGSDGDDKLYGYGGNDILTGGAGNDYLKGDVGNDTYIFNSGFGIDVIEDHDENSDNLDIIKFGQGINPEDVVFNKVGDNLEITIKGTSDKIIVTNYYDGNYNKFEQIEFYNGVVWTKNEIDAQPVYISGSGTLIGTKGVDIFTGSSGDDKLYGYGGADILDGKGGNDYAAGGTGNDTYIFNAGYGVLKIEDIDQAAGNIDTIQFGQGINPKDIIFTRVGDNLEITIYGTTDKIVVLNYYKEASNLIESIKFNDGTIWDKTKIDEHVVIIKGEGVVYGMDGDNNITGSENDDVIFGYGGNDKIIGLGGDDQLYGDGGENGAYGNDILDGGAGFDYLDGGEGSDTYIFKKGYGEDLIGEFDIEGNDVDTVIISGGIVTEDVRMTRNGDDLVISVLGTNDKLTILNYFYDPIFQIEKFVFEDGILLDREQVQMIIAGGGKVGSVIIGTDGNDTLKGTDLNDTFNGKGGDDTFIGGKGNDIYTYDPGTGIKTIVDGDATEGNIDTIKFGAGISPENIIFAHVGNDLEILIKGSNDKVIIKDYFINNFDINVMNNIERIIFADGTVWDQAKISAQVIETKGTDGNDIINGTHRDDIFDGRKGNDTFIGGKGNDTYIINIGSGIKIIEDIDDTVGNIDTIKFGPGISPENIVFVRSGNNLEITIIGSTDKVIIKNYYDTDFDINITNRIEKIEFANGIVWDVKIIESQKIYVIGTDDSEKLFGTNNDDTFDGHLGTDTYIGGIGNDTYIINLGSGIKIIEDTDATEGNIDTIQFGSGINPGNIKFVRVGSNLEIVIDGSSDKVIIKNYFVVDYDVNIANRIERIVFADGTEWNQVAISGQVIYTLGTDKDDILRGTDKDDIFDGRLGNDTLIGAKGNDTYIFNSGSGIKIIEDTDVTVGNIDTIKFGKGISANNIIFVHVGNNLEIIIKDSNDKIIIKNYFDDNFDINISSRIEAIIFEDGITWDVKTIESKPIYTIGTNGNDQLSGGKKDDIFDGKLGNDYFAGGKGNDTYIINLGTGIKTIEDIDVTEGNIDTIQFGADISPEKLTFVRVGSNLEILIDGSSDKVIIKNYFVADYDINISNRIERIVFADGTEWNQAIISKQVIYTLGTNDNDILNGTDKDDVFNGLSGNDTFIGAKGNDTYIFNSGTGIKTIEDVDITAGNIDTIKFGTGISQDNIIFVHVNNNLEIRIKDSNDKIIIKNYFDDNFDINISNRIEAIVFADGITWNVDTIASKPIYTIGTDKDDILNGTNKADIFDGKLGNDYFAGSKGNDTYIFNSGTGTKTIEDIDITEGNIDTIQFGEGILPGQVSFARSGADLAVIIEGSSDRVIIKNYFIGDYDVNISNKIERIVFADGTVWNETNMASQVVYTVGTDGDDILNGTDKNDVFDGLRGNDKFIGGKGNDTYILNLGQGIKTIQDADITDGNVDAIRFGKDILPANVLFVRVDNSLEIRINGTNDKVVIPNYYDVNYDVNLNNFIEKIEFNDGTVWDKATILGKTVYTIGTDGDDTLNGTDKADTFNGLLGNDTFIGAKGNDTYIINSGSGIKTIQDVDATEGNVDTIRFGKDILPGNILFVRVDNSLEIRINGTNDKVVIPNYYDANYDVNLSNFVEKIEFNDGTVWDKAAILSKTVYTIGTDGDDTLNGTDKADTFNGLLGNDTFIGAKGNDAYIINLGTGIKTIQDVDATDGNIDTIKFGEGIIPDNILFTHVGNNLEIIIKDSNDKVIIKDYFDGNFGINSSNSIEKIEFVNGTVWNSADIVSQPIYTVGTNGDDTLNGTDKNDIFDGLLGTDTLIGANGNDKYIINLGSGIKTIQDVDATEGNVDTIRFGKDILPGNVLFVRADHNLEIRIKGSDDKVIIKDYFDASFQVNFSNVIERIEFNDGTVWDKVAILSKPVYTMGTDGDDILYGTDWIDTFDGLLGNDTFIGGNGPDTYLFNLGTGTKTIEDNNGSQDLLQAYFDQVESLREQYGDEAPNIAFPYLDDSIDTIKFGPGILPRDIIFSRNGSNLDIIIKGSNDKAIIKNYFLKDYDINRNNGIERLIFDDGTTWEQSDISLQTIYTMGTNSNDTLNGTDKADTFNGLLGNDTFIGAKGNDTYIINLGSGVKTIQDVDITDGNIDTIKFGSGILPQNILFGRVNNNLEIVIKGTADKVVIKDYFIKDYDVNVSNIIETIEFQDGTVWDSATIASKPIYILGTNSDNTLSGTEKADTFEGLLGNDTFIGGTGNDTYLYNSGTGIKTIEDNDGTEGNIDTIKFGANISPEKVSFAKIEADLEITVEGSSDKVIVKNYFENSTDISLTNKIERIEFANGTVWDETAIANKPLHITGSIDIQGTGKNDVITGSNNVDDIYGDAGNDVITSLGGSDSIYAGEGNDILDGGTGSDNLVGDIGNDTYIFNKGYGKDFIQDFDYTEGNVDTIKFGDGISINNLELSRSGVDLQLNISGTNDMVTVLGYYLDWGNKVEQIKFADGSIGILQDVDGDTATNIVLKDTSVAGVANQYDVVLEKSIEAIGGLSDPGASSSALTSGTTDTNTDLIVVTQ